MPQFLLPKPGGITIPPTSEITFRTAFAIKAATGVDIYSRDTAGSMSAVAWWVARTMPEYQGITYDYVVDNWDLSHLNVVSRYDDADSVLESASVLPVEPDPVIPEDGAGFPVVDP